jgi:osmotically-inducible protein OsmY
MNRRITILMALCATLAAQTRPVATRTAAVRQRTAAAARPTLSDAEIEKAIRARFAISKIAADKFTVHVQGGVATLEGHSDVIQHKGTATRLAKNAGAIQVVNKIQLSQAARDKASANLAKGRRRAQVKRGDPRSSQ